MVASLSESFKKAGGRLQIVGTGPLEAEIAEFIEVHELNSFVELVGFSNDLDSIYARAEYLISSSKFEGLPITFFEAKLHGLKILTFPSSGAFDILGPEDVVTSDFSEDTLRSALRDALVNSISSDVERRFIQQQNEWMLAKHCAVKYYQLVENKLELLKSS